MTRITWAAAGFVCLSAAAGAVADYVPEQAVVELDAGVAIEAINADYGTTVIDQIASRSIYLLQVPAGWTEEELESALEGDPRIREAELNEDSAAPGGQTQSFYFHVAPGVFDEQYAWGRVGLDGVDAPPIAAVTVAVLDTGIERGHPAFAATTVLGGYDFIDDDPDPADEGDGVDNDGDEFVDELLGHGTFNAAIIAHMAPGASLLPIRVLDGDGGGDAFVVCKGIYHAIDAGADVLCLSLGMIEENEVMKQALEAARDAGVVAVSAAGNLDQQQPKVHPAALSHVLGVGSTDGGDVKSPFSNYGDHVDVCAPGTAVVSAVPGGEYGEADGTSAATAIVAGAVAVVRAAAPGLAPSEVEDAILGSAADLDVINPGYVGLLGAGRLDVTAAVGSALEPSADLNGDEIVDALDFLMLLQAWGQPGGPADLDGSGVVDALDYLILLNQWS